MTHTSRLQLLNPQQSRDVAQDVAQHGAFFKVSKAQLPGGAHDVIREVLFEGIERIGGPAMLEKARSRGLEQMHHYFPIEKVRDLKNFAVERLNKHLLEVTVKVGREFLGLTGEFYVDLNTILRINYPFAQAKNAPKSTDDPSVGSGKKPGLTPLQKLLNLPPIVAARARWMTLRTGNKLADMGKAWERNAGYDPAEYHKHLPPAAWAHGPHIDTWYGHAFDGINLWWAIEGVTTENSMVLYPQSFGQDVQPDPKSMYLKPGTPLPEPAALDLGSGDMLLFNPEILHATHLNIVDSTRIAVTMRINPGVPFFDPRAPFVRTQWLQATDIEGGQCDRLKVFPRELHLRIANKQPPPTQDIQSIDVEGKLSDAFTRVCASGQIVQGKLVRVNFGATTVLVMRGAQGLNAVSSRCPHLGLDMADGYHTESRLHCPGHGLVFDFASGESQCGEFKLRAFDVEERDGSVYLRRRARAEQTSGAEEPAQASV